MKDLTDDMIIELRRIADALEQMTKTEQMPVLSDAHQAYVWQASPDQFQPVDRLIMFRYRCCRGLIINLIVFTKTRNALLMDIRRIMRCCGARVELVNPHL